MRKLDWLLVALIGTFLAGAAMAQAIDWAAAGFGAPGQGGVRLTLVDRLMSVGEGSNIARHCPVIFRRS